MKKLAAALILIITFTAHGNGQQSPIVPDSGYLGQCSENDRNDSIYNGNTDFTQTWKSCGKRTNGSANGTTRCLKQHYPELSQACAECFGNYVGCARSHCWAQCLRNPDSADCQACSNSHCQPRLASCSGIPADQLPLFLLLQ